MPYLHDLKAVFKLLLFLLKFPMIFHESDFSKINITELLYSLISPKFTCDSNSWVDVDLSFSVSHHTFSLGPWLCLFLNYSLTDKHLGKF